MQNFEGAVVVVARRRLYGAIIFLSVMGLAGKSVAGTREEAVVEVLRKLREDGRLAQASRVVGLHGTYLSAAGSDRKLVSLALGANYLEASPRLALQYLSSAELACRPGDPVLPVIRYYLAEAKFKGGAYAEAAELAEGLLKGEMADAWRKQVHSLLIESLYAARADDRLIAAFAEYSRLFSFSRRQEALGRLAVEALEHKGDVAAAAKLLEELARGYPTTEESRWAFHRLEDYAESPTAKSRYVFTERLLLHLSKNVLLDTGLAQYIVAAANRPLVDDEGHVRILSPEGKADFLYRARLYEPALKVVRELYEAEKAKHASGTLPSLQLELGRIYLKMSEPLLATRVFADFLFDYPKHPLVGRGLEHLADALRYLGEPLAAAQSYAEALAYQDTPLLRWQHFWALYRGHDYKGALELLDRPGYVMTRDGDDHRMLGYWHARLLERVGRKAEANARYSELLANDADSFYALLTATVHPELALGSSSLATAKGQQASPFSVALAAKAAPDAAEPGPPPASSELKLVDDLLKVGLGDVAALTLSGLKWASLSQAATFAGASRLAMVLDDYRPTRNIRSTSFSALHKLPTNWAELVQHQAAHGDEWKVYFPLAYDRIVGPVAARIRMSPYLVLSVMRAESYYNKDARSGVGAQGLMQLMPYTALKLATLLHDESFDVRDLARPELNIAYGAYYLDKLLRYYDDNPFLAVAAYNGGPVVVNQWLETCHDCTADEFVDSIPYRETRGYVREVMRNYAAYVRIYTGKPALTGLPEMPRELPDGEEIF